MVEIKKATIADVKIIALLGRITYNESHRQYIENKDDLYSYNEKAFSISKLEEELNDPTSKFYIAYKDGFPVAYAKIVLNSPQKHVASSNTIRLERIYVLEDFIPLKIGKQLLDFLINQAEEYQSDSMWLTVYIKNFRAIRFYEKNGFVKVGNTMFQLSGKEYDNFVFEKTIS